VPGYGRFAARGVKSLRVVAGLIGISTTNLHRIETGQRALDSLSEIVALADALQISPSELMRLPVPANGETDSAINAVFLALMAARRRPQLSCGKWPLSWPFGRASTATYRRREGWPSGAVCT
jgi:transcriptional regulator with XRE-family HTH domain